MSNYNKKKNSVKILVFKIFNYKPYEINETFVYALSRN